MSSPFVAEIRIFPYNFAPRGWALCNGQLMPISQNTALFSLLGTIYGGDGKTTFGLPNLGNSVAIGQGQGPGLSDYILGQVGGEPNVTLITQEIPSHNHGLNCTSTVGTANASDGAQLAKGQKGNFQSGITQIQLYSTNAPTTTLNPATAVGTAGSTAPHNNMMPYLTLNYCIALQGVFPARG
ncbi:phage tail protein, partial [Rhizobiaceae sp. 2RAB30]